MKRAPSREQIEAFLSAKHGTPVVDLEPLTGGFWSSAYGYRVGERALVLRLGSVREGFEMDQAAMAYDRPDLPVPVVIEIGDAFDASFAISERHYGRFLETVSPDEVDAVGPAVIRMLSSLRSVADEPDASGSWRRWLTDALIDDPQRRVTGWRAMLAADASLDALYRACEVRIGELVEACPERRDLVHGDLLHANVLVAEDASRVTAVFSWKCSVRGDFLFDIAWCTFWGAWHPGIAAIDVWSRVVDDSMVDAATRHHCYELQIGTTHLGWSAWSGDDESLRAVAAHTAMVLERGPLR